MASVLMSIHSGYVEKILNGTKQYEFRKTRCKKEVDKLFIYETAPVKKVVGEATIEGILEASPEQIWNQTKNVAGIDKTVFQDYFKNSKRAVAYKLMDVRRYAIPKTLASFGVKVPPQSYVYV